MLERAAAGVATVLLITLSSFVDIASACEACKEELGLLDHKIPDSSITASSMLQGSSKYGPANARLNFKKPGFSHGWVAQHSDPLQWVQVDLQKYYKVAGIATQGRGDVAQWVKHYWVMFSLDGEKFYYVTRNDRNRQVFSGNTDQNTVVQSYFPCRQVARYIRIRPITYYSKIAMRFEVIGCDPDGNDVKRAKEDLAQPECKADLGMSTNEINDFQISASSVAYLQFTARINARKAMVHGGWCSAIKQRGQWIQIDFLRKTLVAGIKLESKEDEKHWLTSFQLKHSMDLTKWHNARNKKGSFMFLGNTEYRVIETRWLMKAVLARYIRVVVEAWHGVRPCTKLEILGCYKQDICMDHLVHKRPDSAFTVSSNLNYYYGKQNSRLDTITTRPQYSGWCALVQNEYQWIQVDLGKLKKLFAIFLQGLHEQAWWVTYYRVLYGREEGLLRYAADCSGQIKVFKGSVDQRTHAFAPFDHPVVARYVRINPVKYRTRICVRFEILGCVASGQEISDSESGYYQLGVRSTDTVADVQMTASSEQSATYAAHRGRLDFIHGDGKPYSWIPATYNKNQWLQVDLGKQYVVAGIFTQGNGVSNYWVMSYFVLTSMDGKNFEFIRRGDGSALLFSGNVDRSSPVKRFFPTPLIRRYVRIRVWTYYSYIALRIELFGRRASVKEMNREKKIWKPKVCQAQLGMESGEIADYQISASSQKTSSDAHRARLDRTPPTGNSRWCAAGVRGQYIEVDLLRITKITGVITQSGGDVASFVRLFKMAYSLDHVTWRWAMSNRYKEMFEGNNIFLKHKTNMLQKSVNARFVRIFPQEWTSTSMCMRFDLLGCYRENVCAQSLMKAADRSAKQFKITASSVKYPYKNAVLDSTASNGASCWAPKTVRANEWIQVEFVNVIQVTAIVMQGRREANQWVTQYQLIHSLDGRLFQYAKDDTFHIKKFKGNKDRNSHSYAVLNTPIVARFLRIAPKHYRSYPSMRLDVIGCEATDAEKMQASAKCDYGLGLRSRDVIRDSQISASDWTNGFEPHKGRLDSLTSWLTHTIRNQWIQVDFEMYKKVRGVITQGDAANRQWVKSYLVMTSMDGKDFDYVRDKNGYVMIFNGNQDHSNPVFSYFAEPLVRRFVRIQPWTSTKNLFLRMEVIGCKASEKEIQDAKKELEPLQGCRGPLGMESGKIEDYQISASSDLSVKFQAHNGRLDNLVRHRKQGAAWCAKTQKVGQYIQVNLMAKTKLQGIKIQSQGDEENWVTSFFVQYSIDGIKWYYATRKNAKSYEMWCKKYAQELFPGNNYMFETTTVYFERSVIARYVRVMPQTWHRKICLRFEVLGCYKEQPCVRSLRQSFAGKVTASSTLSSTYALKYSTLDSKGPSGNGGGWCPRTNNVAEFIQVEFESQYAVTGVIMQGEGAANQWVKTYRVTVSPDAQRFRYIKDNAGQIKVFHGPRDRHEHAYGIFNVPAIARIVRVYPLTYQSRMCARFDVIGCTPTSEHLAAEEDRLCDYQIGVSNKNAIPDSRFTANSVYNGNYKPFYARLNHPNHSWRPRMSNLGENSWIQVDLSRASRIRGVITLGHPVHNYMVTSYYVLYSSNGHEFKYISKDGERPMVLKGNVDSKTPAFAYFDEVLTRFVRIKPLTYKSALCLRFELIGCWSVKQLPQYVPKGTCRPADLSKCKGPLGMEDGFIRSYQLSTGAAFMGGAQPTNGRLNYMPPNAVSAFCSGSAKSHQYLQIDFIRPALVSGIKIQTVGSHSYWVMTFKLQYGDDLQKLKYARNSNDLEIFQGNTVFLQTVYRKLKKAVTARYLRVIMLSFHAHPCMRVEPMGCYLEKVCNKLVGLKSGAIRDSKLTASGSVNYSHLPKYARLDGRSAWIPPSPFRNHWIQVDLDVVKRIVAIILQGRQNAAQWTKTFKLQHSNDGSTFHYVKGPDGKAKIFDGNTNNYSPVIRQFKNPLRTRYVRIHPITWQSCPSLRFELISCEETGSKDLPTCANDG